MFAKEVRQSPERLPARVTEAAADAGLGRYEVTWRPQFAGKMIIGLFVVVCLVGVAVELVDDSLIYGAGYVLRENAFMLCVAFAPAALCACLLVDPRQLRLRVFGFTGGLVLRDWTGELGAVPWDGIAAARRALKGGVSRGRNRLVFMIELHAGEAWEVSDASYPRECLDAISGRVERELTARRLPEAEDRIAGGGQVECGGMVVDATGITGSALTVRWSEVLRVEDGFAVVRILTSRGWKDLFRAWHQPTPDVYLLVALIRRLARG